MEENVAEHEFLGHTGQNASSGLSKAARFASRAEIHHKRSVSAIGKPKNLTV